MMDVLTLIHTLTFRFVNKVFATYMSVLCCAFGNILVCSVQAIPSLVNDFLLLDELTAIII